MVYQIRIAVLDDDKTELYKTEQMLYAYGERHPEHRFSISCYTETTTFMDEVCMDKDKVEWAYDILLLDIYLPDGNGIQCGKILRKRGFAGVIIYKSSTDENYMEASAVNAMQYLIKPVSREKLFETLDEAVEKVTAEPALYFDGDGVQIQAKEENRRKSIREFLFGWFYRN